MPRVENRRLGNATQSACTKVTKEASVELSNGWRERIQIFSPSKCQRIPLNPVDVDQFIIHRPRSDGWSVINRCKRASEEGKFRLVGGKTETRGAAVQRRARAEGEGKLSVRINVARRLYRALRIPGNIGNNSNERPPRTC